MLESVSDTWSTATPVRYRSDGEGSGSSRKLHSILEARLQGWLGTPQSYTSLAVCAAHSTKQTSPIVDARYALDSGEETKRVCDKAALARRCCQRC